MRSELNSHHVIKVIALVLMTVDHVGAFWYPDLLWIRAIGRVTVPVWLFLIGHALRYDTSRDMVLWAVVLAALSPFLGMGILPLNILFTMMVCRLLLRRIEAQQLLVREPLMLLVASALFLLPSQFVLEYGVNGFLFALLGYCVRAKQMSWRTGKAVAVVALVAFLATQSLIFEFTPVQMAFVALSSALVTAYLCSFVHRPVTLPGSKTMLWLSRHSLQYYVVHRIIMQAIGVAMGSLPADVHWF